MTSLKHSIILFGDLIRQGVELWFKAGALLVEMIDADPTVFEKITTAYPEVSFETLSTFEAIGRKRIYPNLLLDSSAGSKQAILLPYDEQVRVYAEGVPLVVRKKGGGIAIENVKLSELKGRSVGQVFDRENFRVRSVVEQKNILNGQPEKPAVAPTVKRPAFIAASDRTTKVREGLVQIQKWRTDFGSLPEFKRLVAEIDQAIDSFTVGSLTQKEHALMRRVKDKESQLADIMPDTPIHEICSRQAEDLRTQLKNVRELRTKGSVAR